MKRIIFIITFLVFMLAGGLTQKVSAQEVSIEAVTLMSSEITINQDTSLTINETINYFTPVEKHGIYRYIPERYRREGKVYTNTISAVSVTDATGNKMPFTQSRDKNNLTLKIGDPDVTFSGKRTYKISYRAANAVLRHEAFDELYWDITGEGWTFPVLTSQTRIKSPYAPITDSLCFTGPVGSKDSDCTKSESDKEIFLKTDERVSYGDNFTVAIKLDKNNSLIFPTEVQKMTEFLINNSPILWLFLPGLLMFIYWYKKGRDYRFESPNAFDMDPDQPQAMRPVFEPVNIPMVYEPLKSLTPGEAGAILDERVDNQDVVSEIIDLARKKYLKIERIEEKGFLKFGNDYLFKKLKRDFSKLPAHQAYLIENIFGSDDEVKMSSLKGTFYTHMEKVKEMIYQNLKDQKLFTSKPIEAIVKGVGLAVLLDILAFNLAIGYISFVGSAWPVIILFLSFGATLIFSLKMPQRTAIGTNLYLQAKGLRETIRLGKWREEIKEKHLFIEEVLPFAVSFGVIGKLTKDMAELNMQPPTYFAGGFTNSSAWSGFVNDFSKSAQSGLSYNPSSSSSGGSGFSGGSSGGGGGGGGGGSW